MEKDTTYVALDDSKRKIVTGILRPGDAQPEFREIANDPRLIRRLFERLKREGRPVAACYEAGVSGYDLYRQITALGVECAVMAPALIPRRPGQRVKTDRRDAAKLVRLFRAGELTAIHVPAEAEEAVRDLVRCRDDLRRDVLRWRHRVLNLLTRHGRAYLAGRNWSQAHWRGIRATVTRDGFWWRPRGTIGAGPPSGAPWRVAARSNPTRSSARRGARSSACIAATATSSATASEHRWRWLRSRASWWDSSGPR